jgi:hypothetical protein
MKNILSYLIFCVIFSSAALAQDFSINIFYNRGSNDSQVISEFIYIGSNDSAQYAIYYSGKRGVNDTDIEKVCRINSDDKKKIWETIVEKGLNVNDSLFHENSKMKSSEVINSISVLIITSGKGYKLKVMGDKKEFEGKPLYENLLYLIAMIRHMVSK